MLYNSPLDSLSRDKVAGCYWKQISLSLCTPTLGRPLTWFLFLCISINVNPNIVYHWLVEFDCDLLTVMFYINDYTHISPTNRYCRRANSWGSRSFVGVKNKYLAMLGLIMTREPLSSWDIPGCYLKSRSYLQIWPIFVGHRSWAHPITLPL